jgi:hypothetical protein
MSTDKTSKMPRCGPDSFPMLNLDPDFIRRVRDVLENADFTEKGIPAHLNSDEIIRVTPRDMPHLLRLTSEGAPLDTLIRLLGFGLKVDVDAAERALRPMTIQSWIDGGILRAERSRIVASFTIFRQFGFLLAYDRRFQMLHNDIKPDCVPGPGDFTLILAHSMIREKAGSVMDLGTGSGILGLLASEHAERVVSTDINPRALNIAAFNIALNGVKNVELRDGSLFEPVKGESHDLIMMNSPCAISPENRFRFRDGGLEGDAFLQGILRQAPAHLAENGYFQIVAEWAHPRGIDWRSRLRDWFEGSGCDVWVIRLKTVGTGTYASNWVGETDKEGSRLYVKRWDKWMTYLERQGIEAVSTGVINMRRKRGGSNWFRVSEDVMQIDSYAGEAIHRGFVLRDFLSATSDDALLATPLKIEPNAAMQTVSRSNGDGWQSERITLQHGKGLHYAGNLDNHTAWLVGHCSGGKTVRQLIDELAVHLGVDSERIRRSTLAFFREMIERGMVLPPAVDGQTPN